MPKFTLYGQVIPAMAHVSFARCHRTATDARPFALLPTTKSASSGFLGKLIAVRALRAQVAALSSEQWSSPPLLLSDTAALVANIHTAGAGPSCPRCLRTQLVLCSHSLQLNSPTDLNISRSVQRECIKHYGQRLARRCHHHQRETDRRRKLLDVCIASVSATQMSNVGVENIGAVCHVLALCIAE